MEDQRVIVSEIDLLSRIESHLRQVGNDLGGKQVLFLPNKARGDEVWYGNEEVYAAADARAVGLDAAYLFDGSERRYLSEHSAGIHAIDFAVALSSELSAIGLAALVAFCWRRANRRAVDVAQSVEPNAVPMKITITQRSSNGDNKTNHTLRLEGSTEAVVHALQQLYGSGAQLPQPEVGTELDGHQDG